MKRISTMCMVFIMSLFIVGCSAEESESFTVLFETNGGTLIESIIVEDGKSIQEPVIPVKEGHTFLGWYSDSSLNNTYDFSTGVVGDLTLHAQYEIASYTIQYLDYDQSVLYSRTMDFGDTIVARFESDRKGYAFVGWDKVEPSHMPANDVTLQAVYEEIEVFFDIGLVVDVGGIDDDGYNQVSWEGIIRFAEENNLPTGNYRYLNTMSHSDYLPSINAFSEEELDLIVLPGWLFADSLLTAAENYPDQNYLILDMIVVADNVACVVFAEHEGSFLVGVAAALAAIDAGEDTVGFIGGMDFDLIQKFEAGFEAGVWAVDPTMTVLVDYAGTFVDSQIGRTLAAKQYDAGAYVIFHAAGGTANGIIEEAKDRRTNGDDVWMIGVDKDQYADGIYEGTMSAVLTSMVKRLDNAAYQVAMETLDGNFPGGDIILFDLSNDGVGIPEENPNLSAAIIAAIELYRTGVLEGTYVVPTVPSRLLP